MQEFSSDNFGPFGPLVAAKGSKPAMHWQHMALFKYIIPMPSFYRQSILVGPSRCSGSIWCNASGSTNRGNGTFSQDLVSHLWL